MRTSSVRCCLAAVVVAVSALCAWAETGVTNVITYTTNVAGSYYVGDTGPFNALIITNGGQLIVTSVGYIGNAAAASNNFALVTGAGSVWTNTGEFNVGYSGPGNQLIITDGGVVVSEDKMFMGRNPSSSNNTVIVSGAGSLWTSLRSAFSEHGQIFVGLSGGGNQLIISDGGRVVDSLGYLGEYTDNNAVTVTGSGSLWNNTNTLYMGGGDKGGGGTGNQLTISNGGQVVSINGYVGYTTNATNNSVTVSGSGSIWSNKNLYVGYAGTANRLILTNGGLVVVTNTACVGFTNGANNQIILDGGALDAQRLVVTNNTASATNGLIAFNSGTLTTRAGARIVAPGNFIIGNTPSQTATWNVLGGTNSVEFVTGGVGTFLGGVAGAAGNVTVTGAGTVWTNASVVVVGWSGSGSQLTVTNGGQIFNASGFLGYNADADNNAATVTGSGSVWSNDNLTIGVYGAGNQLTILNSGLVVNAEGYVGRQTSATNNAVTVTGAGAVWSNASHLYLGEMGSGNQLTISDGGRVVNANGYVGYNGGASNAATVSGSGSVWNNTNTLYVGYNGVGNQLTITNGGRVQDIKGVIGLDGVGNRVLVTGANSLWTNSGILVVGDQTDGNQLTITDSGQVVNADGHVGYHASASNAVTVSGAGSVWNNTLGLRVGESGVGNQLTITNGGQVLVSGGQGFVGYNASADNNAVLVSGNGSVLSNAFGFYVGYDGSGNTLTISNGAQVVGGGYVGYRAGANNNAVTVTGSGSVWISDAPYVGSSGAGNQLTITNGGLVVSSDNGAVGANYTATNNAVTVSGSGSVWTIGKQLTLGGQGTGNQLTINDSGAVTVGSDGVLGNIVYADSNAVTVSGSGSILSISNNLYVGNSGGIGNSLTLTNGGAVTVGLNAYVGFDAAASNNTITVAGGSLTVTNAAGTGTLDVRHGTFIFNGGTVAVDRFLANNDSSIVAFNGGTLRVGSGTVSNGSVFSVGGTLIVQSGTLTTANGLTIQNNAALQATGGALLESWGAVTNNGVIDIIYGNTNFHSAFINNGLVLTAEGDPDGDGMSNLQESQAGTSPTNSCSCLRVTSVSCESNNVRITWTAVGGKSYVVQTNSVPGTGFADFSPVIYVPGVGESVTNYVHTGGATNAPAFFYRVRLSP